MIKKVLISVMFLVSMGVAANSYAVVPDLIPAQGLLTDESGVPQDGLLSMRFAIFDAATDGTELWFEERTGKNQVLVTDGFFSVYLGEVQTLDPLLLYSSDQLWLEMTVEGENLGRTRLAAEPFAFECNQVGDLAEEDIISGTGTAGTIAKFTAAGVIGDSYIREEFVSVSPNFIAGASANSVLDVYAATISGGGDASLPNVVTDNYGTVSGGTGNQAGDNAGTTDDSTLNTIGGGVNNTASGGRATISGGATNTASASHSTIGGGDTNIVTDNYGTIGGGQDNQAGDDAGTTEDAEYATVGGGQENTASGRNSTVGGGWDNTASWAYATVGGGHNNTASAAHTTVGGGLNNTASTDAYATVGGGADNTASGLLATIPGGYTNSADGEYSFAAGRRAKANNNGCFIWGDSNDADVTCSTNDRWVARASGGVYFYTNSGLTSGMYLAAGGSSWSAVSDRKKKENFERVDTKQILEKLAAMPIETWNYKTQDAAIRHMGPMAQDFGPAFGLGDEQLSIAHIDADGVALAAIQGLNQKLGEENHALKKRVGSLEVRLEKLESKKDSTDLAALPTGWVLLLGAGLGLILIKGRQRRISNRRRP